ncbi:MAG TPA: hypothetical protein VE969_00535 [Pyrinomonadaceae bacterium]|nr:hypothetical protein [Pyrinomonadaceae bacterium]
MDTTHPCEQSASIVTANYAKTILVRDRIAGGGPGVGQLGLCHLVVVPPLAMRTMEATVLNRFGFRQTDLIAFVAIHKNATTFNFDQENLAGKMKTR